MIGCYVKNMINSVRYNYWRWKYILKVLQIVKTNIGATWAFNQAKWLHGHNIDIITILPSVEGGMAEKYKKNGMTVLKGDFSLPTTKPWKLFSRIKEIRGIIKEIQPDLIHCHFVTNVLMLRIALRNSNILRLFQVPGPLHLENWIFRNAEIILSNKNDYWAGSCKKTCEIYKENGISEDKLFLAYYGNYSTNPSEQYTDTQGILHKEYGLSDDNILVGMVSYFYKPKRYMLQSRGLKGHEDFIDAITIVREKYPSVVGIIIGDAWGNAQDYVQRVKKYADEKCENGIVFTGFRTDIKKVYRELDIAVHPSHSENLGGASESLAAGVPTISTSVGGFPDIVIDGNTGYTVEPKSPQDLARSMIKMIENSVGAERMSQNGKQLVTKLLDIENTGVEILNVYNRIIDGNKSL